MKKIINLALVISFLSIFLYGCGEKIDTKALEDYKRNVESIFSEMETIDSSIKEIDPNDENSINLLFAQLEKLDKAYTSLSQLSVPTEGVPGTFASIPNLANDGATYMTQAKEYFVLAFEDGKYNESALNAANECYARANKRLLYIVDLIHGKLPEGENITYSN